jgi:hypothetical protein
LRRYLHGPNRIAGVARFLPFLHTISDLLASIDPNPAGAVADFHTVFNVLLALIFMLALDQLATPGKPTKGQRTGRAGRNRQIRSESSLS